MSATPQTFTQQNAQNLHWLTVVVPQTDEIKFPLEIVCDPGCTSVNSVFVEVYSTGIVGCYFQRYSSEAPSAEFFLPTLEGIERLRVRVPHTWTEGQVAMVQRG